MGGWVVGCRCEYVRCMHSCKCWCGGMAGVRGIWVCLCESVCICIHIYIYEYMYCICTHTAARTVVRAA